MASRQPGDDKLFFFENPIIDPAEYARKHGLPDPEPETEAESSGSSESHKKSRGPKFRRLYDTENVELFYDLFFVANLTVFTNVHRVNSVVALQQYMGFFSILWTTWFQVALYDVRFTSNSLLERIAKWCQFGVMIGFAATGALYQAGRAQDDAPDEGHFSISSNFRALTLFLMASRFVLVVQYLQVVYFVWKWKRQRIAVMVMAAILFLAGWIYFGLFWLPTPPDDQIDKRYIGWYVLGGFEAVNAMRIPMIHQDIGFTKTHLNKRMSLLTLIILGEGVIGLAEQCQNISLGQLTQFTAPVVANIICAVFILYFLYTIYFHWLPQDDHHPVWQRTWTLLHFPLHLALVLAVEGIRWNLAWVVGVDLCQRIVYQIEDILVPVWRKGTPEAFQSAAEQLQQYVVEPVLSSSYAAAENNATLQKVAMAKDIFAAQKPIILNGTSNMTRFNNSVYTIATTSFNLIFLSSGFEPDEAEEPNEAQHLDRVTQQYAEFNQITYVYDIAYIYFFVTVGVAVIMIAILAAFSYKKHKRFTAWLRIGVMALLGLALSLLSLIVLTDNNYANYIESAWILPTVTLVLLVVFLVNTVPINLYKVAEPQKVGVDTIFAKQAGR